jgi:hypothetical protein
VPGNRSGRFENKESTVDASNKIKAALVMLVAGFLLAAGLAATAQAGNARPQGMSVQEWQGLQARADAMNRKYNLGVYSSRAEALRAEQRRSDEINRWYKLGQYAVVSPASGFDWADAGIGAGAMLGAVLVAGALVAVVTRRRSVGGTSFPRTT